jgi:hypothetical protein
MTDREPQNDPRVASRANLLDEELEAGSADPAAQARAILEDSDARTLDPGAAPGTFLEQRASEDTIDVLEPLPDFEPEASFDDRADRGERS